MEITEDERVFITTGKIERGNSLGTTLSGRLLEIGNGGNIRTSTKTTRLCKRDSNIPLNYSNFLR